MKKIHILGLALFAVFAASAMTAVSASATEWLIGGAVVGAPTSVETKGELLLTDLKAISGNPAGVHCSGIFVGTVGAGAADEIKELLNLANELISSTPLSGLALSCTNDENCPTPEVWPINLPWQTKLEAGGVDDTTTTNGTKKIGYEVVCHPIITVTDTCEQTLGAPTVKNVATGVEGVFAEENTGECTLGGLSGDVAGSGITVTLTGALLSFN
jgi:hypothetical protein